MGDGQDMRIADTAELLERLKRRPEVLGILEYGSGADPGGADVDLCVVVCDRPAGLESVHFWLADGRPVDMNLRTLQELREGGVAELPGFDDVLREGHVLYESQPGLLAEREPQPPGQMTDAGGDRRPKMEDRQDHSFMRHGHAHVLHKLDHYKDRDPLLCKVLLCGATHWLLSAYTAARGLPYRGEKAALRAIRENDPDLAADLEKLAAGERALAERIELLRRLTDQVLAPVGGPWRRDEALFFADAKDAPRQSDRWNAFAASLLGSEGRNE